ncbi:MAG: MraY family glycosyltransferase, partial [Halanaerobiales bacterium]
MGAYFLVFFFSLIISFMATPIIKKLALFINAVDIPNDRRINRVPIPTLGGIAIYLGFMGAMFFSSSISNLTLGIFVGGSFILLIGILDDLYELSARLKLAGQILAAIILILFNIRVEFITNPFSGGMIYLGYWGIPLTILWIIGITNTVNLVDGLDGLAAGISTIAAFTLFFVALQEGQVTAAILSLILAGSALGFLPYNFNPAKIFMGDTGAMFCGYILAAISVAGALKSAATV